MRVFFIRPLPQACAIGSARPGKRLARRRLDGDLGGKGRHPDWGPVGGFRDPGCARMGEFGRGESRYRSEVNTLLIMLFGEIDV